MIYKKCNKCNEIKSASEFHKMTSSPLGLQHFCKVCQLNSDKEIRERRKINGPTIIRDSKECQICHNKKPISQFGKRSNSADGHLSYCKPCWVDYVKKQQKKHKK